jgi:cytochrome P450
VIKTQLKEVDVVSLLLNSGQEFSDEEIADEMLDFLIAGTETSSGVAQNLMMHFADSPEDLERLRQEIKSAKDKVIDKDPQAFANLS